MYCSVLETSFIFPGNGIRHRDKSEREKEEERRGDTSAATLRDAERAREHVKAPSIKSNFSSRVCSYRLSVKTTLSFLLLLLLLYNIVDCRDEQQQKQQQKKKK